VSCSPRDQGLRPHHRFDRYQHRDILQLLYYENIARYVEQGGALLVAAATTMRAP
jgi:hypothetical protein